VPEVNTVLLYETVVIVIMGLQDAFNYVLQNPLVTGTIEYVKVVVCLS
jgi:hypothetical protein